MDDYGTPWTKQRDRELKTLLRYEKFLGRQADPKTWYRYNEMAFFRSASLVRKGVQPMRAKVIAYREAVAQLRSDMSRKRKRTRTRTRR